MEVVAQGVVRIVCTPAGVGGGQRRRSLSKVEVVIQPRASAMVVGPAAIPAVVGVIERMVTEVRRAWHVPGIRATWPSESVSVYGG